MALDIPLHVLHAEVAVDAAEGIEAAARAARYGVIATLLDKTDVLLTAQHADDQAETLLLQLLRGAGTHGLAAMGASRQLGAAYLLRPWLEIRRATILHYARQRDLCWIEDESNDDIRFSRNFLRHRIMPELARHWPGVVPGLVRATHQQAEAAELLDELAALDLAELAVAGVSRVYYTGAPLADIRYFSALDIQRLNLLSPARRRNAVRAWIRGQDVRPPPATQLAECLRQLENAGQSSVRWQDGTLQCYRGLLYLLQTTENSGVLNSMPCRGGLSVSPQELTIRFRQGGETFFWRGHHHTLKKLFQARNIPPWLRTHLPLLYYHDELVAVPGVGCHAGFVVADHEVGWQFAWQV
jgi:tRNA(Ile)-lysidine synthase